MINLKNILITGANRGIGFELVKESIAKGYSVVGTFRNKQNSVELLKIKSDKVKFLEMDVVDETSISKVSSQIAQPLDYLICNAGINNGYGNFFHEDHSHEKMLEVLNVNVLGCILTIKHLSKNLNRYAKIILISSIMGTQEHKGSNATIYRASKAAVNNVMVSISEEFKSKDITVASFHPGWVRTAMGGPNATLSAKDSAVALITGLSTAVFCRFFDVYLTTSLI
tara:strand:- start:223 stop:900 length:678 start_codon:yes stop_codon:yes gene_type:complete